MKRVTILCMIFFLALGTVPALANPDAGTKLARGAGNLTFGWFEIVNEMGHQSDIHGPLIGVPAGFLRGTVFCLGRMLAGVFEIITFPFPNGQKGYQPVVLPESVFARR